MSRKRHGPKDIIGIDESLTPHDLYQSKAMESVIQSVMSTRDIWTGYSFMFSGRDGELVEQHVNAFRLHLGQVSACLVRNNGPVLYPVMLKLCDGTSEYGFKVVQNKTVRTGRRQLTSYYVTDGIMNPSNGKWEYPNSLRGSEYPCPEVQDRLSLFNGDDDCVAKKLLRKAQYNEIQTWLTLGREYFVRTATKRPETPISGIERRIEQKPMYVSPPRGYENWHNVTPVFMAFVRTRYLKSVYVDETKNKNISKLFRLSDLLMVTSGEVELWTSLDSTCHGIF